MSGLSAVSPLNVGEVSFTENHDRTDASHFTAFCTTRAHSERYFQTVFNKSIS